MDDRRDPMAESVEKILTDIHSATHTIEEENRYLEEYRNWLSTAEEEWDDRIEAERESFRVSAEDLIIELRTNAPEWDFLEKFSEKLQQSYKEPVLESIQHSIERIAELLRVSVDDLDLDTDAIKDRFGDSPSSTREEYQESLLKLEEADELVIDHLQPIYESDPYLLFQADQLLDDIDRSLSRSSTLSELVDYFEDIGWLHEEIRPLLLSAERLDSDVPTQAELSEYISIIEEVIDEFEHTQLNIEIPISKGLINELAESDIESAFENIAIRSNEVSKEFGEINQIVDITELDSDSFPTGKIVDDWESIVESEHESIGHLSKSIDDLSDSFNTWCDQQSSRWSEIREVARYYVQELDEIDTHPPSRVGEHIENGLRFRDDVVTGLEIIRDTEEWLESQKEALREELGNEAVDLLDDLIEHSEVRVNDYSSATIETVSQNIDLILRIDDES